MFKPYFRNIRHIIIFSLMCLTIVTAACLFVATLMDYIHSGGKTFDEANADPLFNAFVVSVLLIPLFFIIFLFDLLFYFASKKKWKEQQKNPKKEEVNQMEINIEPTSKAEENKEDVSELKPVEKSDNVFMLKAKEKYTYGDGLLIIFFLVFWALVAIFFIITLTTATIALLFNLKDIKQIITPTCIGAGAGLLFVLFIFFFGAKSTIENFENTKTEDLTITLHDYYLEQSMYQENLKAGIKGTIRYNLYYKGIKYMKTKKHVLFKGVVNRNLVMLMLDRKEDGEVASRIIAKIKEYRRKK